MRTGLAYIAITVLGGSCLWPAAAAEPSAGGNQGRIVFSSNRSGPWRIWSVPPDGSALAELTKAGPDEQDVDPGLQPRQQADPLHLDARRRDGRVDRGRRRLARPGGSATATRRNGRPTENASCFRRRRADLDPRAGGGPGEADHARKIGRIAPARRGARTASGWPSLAAGRRAMPCSWWTRRAASRRPVYDKKGACEPHWSPDGKRLVYETETHICTIDPDGKKNRPVTYFGGVQRYGRFSPDGKIDRLLPRGIGAGAVGTVHHPGPGRHAAETHRGRLRHEPGLEITCGRNTIGQA